MRNSRQRPASIVAFVTLFLFAGLFTATQGFSGTIFWTGVGANMVSGSSNNLALGSNWTGGAVPGTTDDAAIILTNNTGPASLTNAVGNAFSVQNLTITNTTSRSVATPTDSITFNGPVTLSSNLLVAATVNVSTYTLTVTLGNSFTALNATLDGMLSLSKAGTLTLNFAGTTSIKSNLTFDATTESAGVAANKETTVLNILGTTTVGSNLTFLGGAGQNTINVNGQTTVSNDFKITGNSGLNATINQVIVNSNLTVLGTLSLSGGLAVAAGPLNTLALNAPTVTVSNLIVSGTGSISYLTVAGGSTATVLKVRNNFITDSLDLNNGEIRIGGAFSNVTTSANAAGFQADTGTFTFNGGGSTIQTTEVASAAGFGANNYVFGTFQVGDSLGETGFARLVDSVVNNGGGTEQLVASNLSVFGGGTLDLNGLAASFRNGTNAGTILGLTTTGRGLDVSNHLDNTGTIILGGGSIGGNGVISNAGSFLAVTGGGVVTNLLVNTASGILDTTNGTLVLVKNPVLLGTMNVRNGGTNKFGLAGGLVITNSGTINLFGGALVQASLSNAGRIVSVSGGLISNSVINGASGFIIANGGNLVLTSNLFNFGSITNAATITVGATGAGSVTNAATIVMTGGNLFAGAITNTGTIVGFGTISGQSLNSGLIGATNGELRLTGVASGNGAYRAVAGTSASTLTFAGGGSISSLFNTNATIRLENMLTNTSVFVNQGTLTLAGGTYQSAANFTNAVGEVITNVGNGTLNAAGVFNFGSIQAVAGTLTISNLFAQGGTVFIGPGGTLTTTGIGALTNFGTISLAGATGAGNNAILNLGTAAITNLAGGTITGGGIVQDASQIVNLGNIFATSSAVELQFTNANTFGNAGRIGASTGATLTFGSAGVGSGIITNFGTINLTGGTLRSGTISNRASGTIMGVGNVIATVVNNGTIMAANPVAGLNVLSVGMNDFNDATLGASNGAILNLVLSGGAGSSFNNNGTITMLGGTLVISNGAPGVITNDLFVTGSGTITPAMVNVTSATILASNGVLTIGLFNNLNSGTLHNFDGGSSINLTNAVLVNTGTIALGGGGLIMAGVITNQNAITGPGVLGASLVNDTTGTILATNGTLTVGTNTGAFVINRGVATISSSGVLNVVPSWLNTNGTIQLAGGVVSGGALTNKGTIAGFGTFSNTIYNATGGTINVASGNTLQIVPAWNNVSGSVNLTGGLLAGGAVTNLSLITGFGTVSSAVVNNSGGILTAVGGILTLSNAPVQNGTFIVTNTGTLNIAVAWNNNGTVSLRGGTVIGGTLTNLNQLTGFGTITPLLVNGAGSTLTAAGGTLTLSLAPVQNGTVVITNGGTLDVATAWQNSGTVSLMGGTLIDGTLTNLNGARILGYGTVAANLINSGTLLASSGAADLHLTGATVFNQTNGVFGASSGRLIVDTVFTNAGTVSFINSVGTFDSAVVNKGAWVMSPSTNVFLANYTVATNGYVSMASGAVSIFKSNFVNVSTLSNNYNTLNGKFVMDGHGTQQFFVAGINLGGYASTLQSSNETFFTTANGTFSTNAFNFSKTDAVFGYSNNFALGTLELSSLSTTVVMDAFGTVGTNDGQVAGLYLNTLTLDPGSLLIISNNVELYFQSTNGVTGVGLGVLGAGDNILILNGGSLHQIGVVPEPSVLMLLALGAFIIHKYRQRS